MAEGTEENMKRWQYLALTGILLIALLVLVEYRRYQVEVRNHNMETFFRGEGCEDLPTDVEKCRDAINKFMWPETGLFTVGELE